MKTIGLDGRVYKWLFPPEGSPRMNESNLHTTAREVIHSLYPMERVIEEVFLPGCGEALYVDFFIGRRRIMVEVQGVQHYEYVPHFHQHPSKFNHQQTRDEKKRQFARQNEFTLIELPYWETPDEWRERILRLDTTTPQHDQQTQRPTGPVGTESGVTALTQPSAGHCPLAEPPA